MVGLTVPQDDETTKQALTSIVSQWYFQGNAADFIAKNGSSLALSDRIYLWKGVVQGLDYLHNVDPAIVHGDLKPKNILIDDFRRPRICDFGLSRIVLEEGHSGLTTTAAHTGTPRYLAYELVISEDDMAKPTRESDIYALGCVGLDVSSFAPVEYGDVALTSVLVSISPKPVLAPQE
ncbi:hypothetical protein FRC17_000780 [Serendipita sp. 399]|nr:hypothetical protein FRC17_000780 [Serendipita sp. 399]